MGAGATITESLHGKFFLNKNSFYLSIFCSIRYFYPVLYFRDCRQLFKIFNIFLFLYLLFYQRRPFFIPVFVYEHDDATEPISFSCSVFLQKCLCTVACIIYTENVFWKHEHIFLLKHQGENDSIYNFFVKYCIFQR